MIYHPYYFLWKQLVLPLIVLVKRIDVLICPDYVAPIIGFNALKLAVLHDVFFWEHKTHYNSKWRAYYTWMVEQGLRKKAVGITTSNYSKEKLALYLPEVPFKVVYQCAKSLAEDADLGVLDQYKLNNADYILHVGYFDKRKNLPLLIDSFKKLKSTAGGERLKLVLVGKRASSSTLDDYDNVVEIIKKLELQDEIVLPGYVSNEELKALYTKALFYVFPSKDEGFGIPVLEAMMHNIPVIISDAGSLSEIGGDAVLKFELDTPEDLYHKMYKLYSSKDLRVKLRDKGSKRAAQFNRDFFYEQFEEIIDAVLESKS